MRNKRYLLIAMAMVLVLDCGMSQTMTVNAQSIEGVGRSVSVTDDTIAVNYKGAKALTKKQAEKAVKNQLDEEGTDQYYIVDTIKKKKKIVVWVKWTQMQTFSKYVINRKTGSAKRYSIYVGYDMPDTEIPPSVDLRFNARDYL